MLPPKLGHIIGCLAFTEYFFVKNETLPRSNHFLKIQLKIIFLTFLNTDRNAPTKNLEQKYGHFHFKSALKINFWLREVVKLKIHVFAYTCIFSLTTSWSRKLIFKADENGHISILNFFLERFGQYLKKSKNGLSIVFSKSDSTWVGFYFWRKKNSEKAKHPEICLSLGGSMPEAQIWKVPNYPR